MNIYNIDFDSKWYLTKDTKSYSFDSYLDDLNAMSKSDITDNMAAELYKLNDINRQKTKTMRWVMRFFSISLITAFLITVVFLITNI